MKELLILSKKKKIFIVIFSTLKISTFKLSLVYTISLELIDPFSPNSQQMYTMERKGRLFDMNDIDPDFDLHFSTLNSLFRMVSLVCTLTLG